LLQKELSAEEVEEIQEEVSRKNPFTRSQQYKEEVKRKIAKKLNKEVSFQTD